MVHDMVQIRVIVIMPQNVLITTTPPSISWRGVSVSEGGFPKVEQSRTPLCRAITVLTVTYITLNMCLRTLRRSDVYRPSVATL